MVHKRGREGERRLMPQVKEAGLERGIYALSELHRYVMFQHRGALPRQRVQYWMNHALSNAWHRPRRPDYSFHDLVSLFVVSELTEAGVRASTIREAEEHLRRRFGTARPFATTTVYTDGVDVLYEAEP